MLENHFRHYCQELVSKTYNFGWGVYSNMKYYYEEFVNQK